MPQFYSGQWTVSTFPKEAVAKLYFKALPYSNFNLSERRFGAHIEGFATAYFRKSFASYIQKPNAC